MPPAETMVTPDKGRCLGRQRGRIFRVSCAAALTSENSDCLIGVVRGGGEKYQMAHGG